MSGCTQCMMTKKFLADHGIDYDEVDASSPEGQGIINEYGVKHCPFVVDGDKFFGNYGEVVDYYGNL